MCGRCTAKVERVLLSVDGVEFARADLVSKQVDVLAAPQVTRHHLVDALEGCGHGVSDITGPLDPEEAPPSATPVGGGGVPPGATSGEDPTPRDPRTTALHVPGMVCAHCKAKVERVLRLLTGVEEVSPPPPHPHKPPLTHPHQAPPLTSRSRSWTWRRSAWWWLGMRQQVRPED